MTLRWDGLADVFNALMPELREVVTDALDDADEDTGLLGTLWPSLVVALLDADDRPIHPRPSTWPTLLAVMEQLLALAKANPHDEPLVSDVNSAVVSGILCDLTRSRSGLRQLLPYMGPLVAAAAAEEVRYHRRHALLNGRADIDWESAGVQYRALDPSSLPVPVGQWR